MKLKAAGVFLLFVFCCAAGSAAAEYVQLPGVVQVHSTVGSGLYSMEELVALAKEMGLEVLVMTDCDQVVMEDGVYPFRNLIKKKVERNSVLKLGPEKYLSLISQINQRQRDVLLVPGVQSAPFYYWTGSSVDDNLTAHNYRKELLLIGMMSADDYRDLPRMHRGFSTRYVKDLLPRSMVFLISFLLGIYLVFQRGYLKASGMIIALVSAALLINYHPFQSSRFDAYHGDQGIAPYQDMIDYVNERGGLTFWAHPESNYSKSDSKLGPIKLVTAPYADSLLEARNYTGFATIYGDAVTAPYPGKKWDQLLNEYCFGWRSHPVWGVAGANFLGEVDGVRLDTFQTIFITRSKSVLHIIDALAKGRVYAKRKEKGGGLTLSGFSVEDAGTGAAAMMGADVPISAYPVIRAKVTSDDTVQHIVKVLLVKGGAVLHRFEGETPFEFVFADKLPWVSKSYYRLEVQSPSAGKLISNPIFADRKIALRPVTEDLQSPKASAVDTAAANEKARSESPGEDRKRKYPARPAGVETEKEADSAVRDHPQPDQQMPESRLTITAVSVPYSVQVASLPSLEHAQKTLADFQQQDLPVYHVKVNLGDKGNWWRIYVGWFATQKEAMTARETYGLRESIVQSTPYANRVGVYASEQEIEAIRKRLETMGYAPYVVRRSLQAYHLYVGAFVTLKGAEDLQRELKVNGIAAEVVKR